jgi:hypothetical protein
VSGTIDRDALATYLNDHLAGSVAAIDLLDNLIESEPGEAAAPVLARFRAELGLEQDGLRALVESVQSENKLVQAMAWVGEKVARVKLGAGPGASALKRFEALEALEVGFTGRRLLWRTLAHLHRQGGLQSNLDFEELERRASSDIDEVEKLRLEAATAAMNHSTVP